GHWRPWEPPPRDGIPWNPAFSQHVEPTATTRGQQPCKGTGRSHAPRDQDRNMGPHKRGVPGSRATPSFRNDRLTGCGCGQPLRLFVADFRFGECVRLVQCLICSQERERCCGCACCGAPASALGSCVEGASPSQAGFVRLPSRCRSLLAILLLGSKGRSPWPWFPKGRGQPLWPGLGRRSRATGTQCMNDDPGAGRSACKTA
ncbi:MAG: hypothetical protein RL318_2983, partial [Fibrobacterota bacterium]